jgi:uncharacterized metal-binding protein
MAKECARCHDKECYDGRDCFGLAAEARKKYSSDELRSMRVSGRIEAEHYMKLTRLEEIILYAREMGMKKLGIAFCIGLSKEAEIVDEVLIKQGFETHSACCKICGLDKSGLKVKKLHGPDKTEAVCNPIGQALRLESVGTELNIAVGLCVGHDIMFTAHSASPVTTLIVKDRVLAHNPAGALYSAYYREKRYGLQVD